MFSSIWLCSYIAWLVGWIPQPGDAAEYAVVTLFCDVFGRWKRRVRLEKRGKFFQLGEHHFFETILGGLDLECVVIGSVGDATGLQRL